MDDLFDPRTNLSDPSGGVEVPVFAKSGPVWKPEQPKEAEKVISVPGACPISVTTRVL